MTKLKRIFAIIAIAMASATSAMAYNLTDSVPRDFGGDRFVLFYISNPHKELYRMDTRTGQVTYIKVNNGNFKKNKTTPFVGAPVIDPATSRNGRFATQYIGNGEFWLYDTDSGRIWQSNVDKHQFNELAL